MLRGGGGGNHSAGQNDLGGKLEELVEAWKQAKACKVGPRPHRCFAESEPMVQLWYVWRFCAPYYVSIYGDCPKLLSIRGPIFRFLL